MLLADAEWLLDNFYVVEEQLREIRDDLPRSFYRELPKTASGTPRIQAIPLDRCRHAVEELAKGSRASEVEVANAVLALSAATGQPEKMRHVGYWLIDAGRPHLERSLKYRPPWHTLRGLLRAASRTA